MVRDLQGIVGSRLCSQLNVRAAALSGIGVARHGQPKKSFTVRWPDNMSACLVGRSMAAFKQGSLDQKLVRRYACYKLSMSNAHELKTIAESMVLHMIYALISLSYAFAPDVEYVASDASSPLVAINIR